MGAKQVLPTDGLMLITKEGKIIRISVDGVRVSSRSTQGVKLMDLDEGDRLVAVAKLADRAENEDADLGEASPTLETPSTETDEPTEPVN